MADTFSAVLLSEVEQLLAAMGYEAQAEDEWLLGFCVDRVIEQIQNACNVSEVPEGLSHAATVLCAAEFLTLKIGSGNTSGLVNIDFSPLVRQLQEGDTNIVYAVDAGSAPSAQLLNTLEALKAESRTQFVSYRRIKW